MSALATVVPTVDDVPQRILDIRECLQDEFKALAQLRQLHAQGCARWARMTHVSTAVPDQPSEAIRTLVRSAVKEVAAVATDLLSQPGAPLVCDVSAWVAEHLEAHEDGLRRRAFRHSRSPAEAVEDHWATFDPVQLWHYIIQTYSPTVIADQARRRAAVAIVDAFCLSRSGRMKRQAGRIELTCTRYSEKVFGHETYRRYKCYGDRSLVPLVEAFQVFLVDAGIDPASHPLHELAQLLVESTSYSFHFTSRQRHTFAGGSAVVFFNNEVKVYIPDAPAAALNLFVSTYAGDRLDHYRA